MGFIFQKWMKIGRHYTPRKGQPGYDEWKRGDSRAAKQAIITGKPQPVSPNHPTPVEAPEPDVKKSVVRKAAETTVNVAEVAIETTASVVEATVKAPIKVAGAVAGATVEGTKAVAGATMEVASAGAEVAVASIEAVVNAPRRAVKATTNAFRRKPSKPEEEEEEDVVETPEESLAPTPKIKTGGFISGMECQYCGKTYRLDRYFKPHVEKCPLNPANIRG
jgi:hypothetical protein